MKRLLSVGFALSLLSSAFAACTMDFDQFSPNSGGAGGGGAGGTGGTGATGGNCTAQCCSPADCPAPSDPCVTATCNAGTCGEDPIPDGTEAGMQTVGDCKKLICQGGKTTSVNEEADPFDDGNDCTIDTCVDGMPTSTASPAATPCTTNGGQVCNGSGACVGCLSDVDCPANAPNCDEGSSTCVSAQCNDGDQNGNETDTDCGGSCPPCGTGDTCLENTDCQSGVCKGGGGNMTCSAPACDDGVQNGNETDVDCGANCGNCGPGQGCDQNSDCEGNQCTGAGGTCVPNCSDEVKNNQETDVDCGGGTCPKCAVGDDCAMPSDCLSGVCTGGKCALSPLGATCAVDGDCASGQCADGVCCNANCAGLCQACDLPGSVGTCTDIPSGNDPDNECLDASVCDGAGACKKPMASLCNNAGECLSGFCKDGVCCNEACLDAMTCKACNVAGSVGTCTNIPAGTDPDNECTGQQNCNGMGVCM